MNNESKVLSIIGIITAIIVFGGVYFLSRNNTSSPSAQNPTAPVEMALLTANAPHNITFSDAKVTITEFADYQCPACAKYYPEMKQIQKEYEGKVNFYFRHFPLPMHPYSRNAAKAAEAAGEQNKFWEMSELLFARQESWAQNPKQSFMTFAKELGLDEKAFSELLESSKYDGRIEQDIKDATALNVNSTPTIFINDKKMTIEPSASNLRIEIDKILNN